MALKYVQTNTLYLAGSGVLVGATSVILTSLTDIYGNVLTMSDFGAMGFITLEPDTTNEEAAIFTSITANTNGTYTLGGISTILAKSPYTQTSGLVRQHSGGTKCVITDNVGFWNTFANKNNDETILGNWTFNNAPTSLSATRASTTALGNVKLSAAAMQSLGTATLTIASPGVVTNNAHGLIAGDSVQFTTTGSLPTGLSAATDYYVIAAGLTANTFEVSATVAGSVINTSGTQSGVHTLYKTTPVAVSTSDSRYPTASGAQFISAVTGMVISYAGSAAPTGFLMCDGSAVSRATYSALFSAIGTAYGVGDGSTTFNLPDGRGRQFIGAGAGTKIATFASRASNVITVTGPTNAGNNEFQTGQLVNYVSTGTPITGLTSGTNYYLIRTGNLSFSLATSLANSQNGTIIALSSDGTGTQTFTLTLTTRTTGDTGGEENHAMSSTELLSHDHLPIVRTSGNTGSSDMAGASGASSTSGSTNTTTYPNGVANISMATKGGNTAMNNMTPFFVGNWIIKT